MDFFFFNISKNIIQCKNCWQFLAFWKKNNFSALLFQQNSWLRIKNFGGNFRQKILFWPQSYIIFRFGAQNSDLAVFLYFKTKALSHFCDRNTKLKRIFVSKYFSVLICPCNFPINCENIWCSFSKSDLVRE